MGKYIAVCSKLQIYVEMKNEEKSLRILEEMIDGINTSNRTKKSMLYQHMKFNENGLDSMKDMIKKALESDEELNFLRENVRYKNIINKLS